jgi:hypothetical protein
VSIRLRARTCLVAGLICLQTADLICTYLLLDGGHRADVYEANPLARSILHAGGWVGVALFKLSITAVAVLASLLVSRRRPVAALRLLGLLCAVMLGVNAYSGTLLASPDAEAVAKRHATEVSDRLDNHITANREFCKVRETICDSVLDGGCDTAEASTRLSEVISDYGPKLHLPRAARLPDPSRTGEVLAYVNYHLRTRAKERGLTGRLTDLGTPAPTTDRRDPFTPPWVLCTH